MTDRTYPYKAWVLMPSFKPVEIELTHGYAYSDYDGDETAVGKYYARNRLHATKAAAIAAGRVALDKAQADIDKRTANLNKKRAALDKAERA